MRVYGTRAQPAAGGSGNEGGERLQDAEDLSFHSASSKLSFFYFSVNTAAFQLFPTYSFYFRAFAIIVEARSELLRLYSTCFSEYFAFCHLLMNPRACPHSY